MTGLKNRFSQFGKRTRIILYTLVTVFVLYTLAGFFVAGPVLRSVLSSQLTTALHRNATVESVRINPLTLRAQIYNLAVSKKEGTGNLLAFSLLDTRLSVLSVFKFAPLLAYLHLEEPQVDVQFMGHNTFSFSDILPADEPAPTGDTQPADAPTFPFRVENLRIVNGTVVFRDDPHKTVHTVSEIHLSVPLTSSLHENSQDFVEPALSARVNGQPIELKGKTKLFDKTLATEFVFETAGMDLAQYWQYVPVKTPLKLTSALLDARMSILFMRPEGEGTQIQVMGEATLADVAASAPAQPAVFGFQRLHVRLDKYSLAENTLSLGTVELDAPHVRVVRDEKGVINWMRYLPSQSDTAESDQENSSTPLILDIAHFSLRAGRVEWHDSAVPGGFARQIRPISLTANALSTRSGQRGTLSLEIGGHKATSGTPTLGGTVAVRGSVVIAPLAADVTIRLAGLSLPEVSPYARPLLPLEVDSGILGAQLRVVAAQESAALPALAAPPAATHSPSAIPGTANATAEAQASVPQQAVQPLPASLAVPQHEGPHIHVLDASFTLDDLALRKPQNKFPSVAVGSLQIKGGQADLQAYTADVASLLLREPRISLVRTRSGLDLVTLFSRTEDTNAAADNAVAPDQPGSSEDGKADAAPPAWNAGIRELHIEDGRFIFTDRTLSEPGRLVLSDMRLAVRGLSTDLSAELPVQYSSLVSGGRRSQAKPGRFSVDATVRVKPLTITADIQHDKVPLVVADAYLAEYTGLLLADGALSSSIHARLTAPEDSPEDLQYDSKGTLRIDDLSLKSATDSSSVAGFSQLEIRNYDVSKERSRLHVDEVVLTGLSVDAGISEKGALNITELLRPAGAPAKGDTPREVKAQEIEDDTAPYRSVLPFAEASIGLVRVEDGRLQFTDHSVQPTFSASVSNLNARLETLSLDPAARPALNVTAKLEGQPLSLSGTANPLIVPIFSDLVFSANGLELVPVSPYAMRSLAYPIERGRLYADVTFRTENWVLDAKNRFLIEQLQLGDRSKQPDAPNIPVKLGLALLSDSNGDIDISLPIHGRLDDPQFRTGGIIMRAFINLLVKAVASPFSLVGGLFSGSSSNAQFLIFDPGSDRLDEKQMETLKGVATFLQDKPTIKLEISGFTNPQADAQGLVQERMLHALREQKLAGMSRRERAALDAADVVIEPEEYERYLTKAYEAVPEGENDPRPSGLFGFKEQPQEAMETFLRSRETVTPQALDELALDRARAVREAILTIAPQLESRVFLTGVGKKPSDKPGIPLSRVELGVR